MVNESFATSSDHLQIFSILWNDSIYSEVTAFYLHLKVIISTRHRENQLILYILPPYSLSLEPGKNHINTQHLNLQHIEIQMNLSINLSSVICNGPLASLYSACHVRDQVLKALQGYKSVIGIIPCPASG